MRILRAIFRERYSLSIFDTFAVCLFVYLATNEYTTAAWCWMVSAALISVWGGSWSLRKFSNDL